VRRRRTVKFLRADQMFRTLKAARLDNSVEVEMRALARVDVLLIDDFALQAMDAMQTSDFDELVVERHQRTSTILTSNRDPVEWIAVMSDRHYSPNQPSTDSSPPATNSSSKESPTAAANDHKQPAPTARRIDQQGRNK
jgi:hypothetical protein